MIVDLAKQYRFEAAHETAVQGVRRLHGHSYVVEVVASGPVDPHLGWLVDYGEITKMFNPIYKELDHNLLNDVPGLADVSLAGVQEWITARLKPELESLKEVRLSVAGPCQFQPAHVGGDRMRFGFEAAHFLPNLPDHHKCKRMHGHSFTVEVGLRDSHPVVPLLEQVYDELDHECLNTVPGLENPTSEHVCRWIWNLLAPQRADLYVVAVAETCTARCEYHGS